MAQVKVKHPKSGHELELSHNHSTQEALVEHLKTTLPGYEIVKEDAKEAPKQK